MKRESPPSKDDQAGLFATLVNRPIGLLVVFVTLIVIGVLAYIRIPLQMLPSGLQGTRMTVWVNHPGSSASENEEKVARPLEEQLRTLPNLKEFSSFSSEGSVRLRVVFNGVSQMDLAKAELRDRIERARPDLPDTVDRIFVWTNDDGEPPIMFFALLVEERTPDLDFLVEHHVQRKLEGVDGVSRVQIWGMLDDSVRILLDEDRVRATRLDLGQLIGRLAVDNFAQPMGEITDGGRRFLLRSDMRFESLEQVGQFPIGNGLRIADVARVEKVKTVRDRLTRIDGKVAYYGMIQKESTANVVEVAEGLKRVIAGFETDPQIQGKVGMTIFFDQARFIQNSLAQLESTAVWGGGLAVLILFLFLRRVRMTLCVALSIPTSALLAIAYENFTGGTFNVLTMTGLTLGIGMLVDNSVVVMENIARLKARGQDAREAAVDGVRDVGLAIALATMTSVVVFLPLIFMGNNPTMRTMLGALGVPLCASLVFSLIVALFFLPVVSARILGERPRVVAGAARLLTPLVDGPVRLLALGIGAGRAAFWAGVWCAHRCLRGLLRVMAPLRWPLAAGVLALVAWRLLSTADVKALGEGLERMGVSDGAIKGARAALIVTTSLAGLAIALLLFGTRSWRTALASPLRRPDSFVPHGVSVLAWIQGANRALLSWTLHHRLAAACLSLLVVATVSVPMGRMTMTAFGQDEDTTELAIRVRMENNFTLSETSDEMLRYEDLLEGYREELGFAHIVSRFRPGSGEVELRWDERQDPEDLARHRDRLRKELPKIPGHQLFFSREQQMDVASRQYVHFQLRGPRADVLESYGERAVALLEQVPGLLDVSSSLEDGPEQIKLSLDRETAYSYGVTSESALRSVSWALRGAALPRYQEEGRELPFIIEYDEEKVAGLDTLRELDVFTATGRVPLASFAKLEFQRGRRGIYRENGLTTFDIQARVTDPNRQGELVEDGYAALDGLEMPRGFTLGRDSSVLVRQQEEMGEMRQALNLSVVLVFLLMGILFESVLLPFSVLTTIPFAVVGALWTLYVTGTVMDSVGWIGVIILVGVVVNNGIVLIDKIHRLRVDDGLKRFDAVLEGAAARVRPILMTALTTIFGLLPMALGAAPREGIDYRALAVCVAGGLAVSTFFTLWVVPLAYTVMDDFGRGLTRMVKDALGLSVKENPDLPSAPPGYVASPDS
jgi:hydrophobic/amphiphilic exporter-1 (mainly G- bacteria), HAE1 family